MRDGTQSQEQENRSLVRHFNAAGVRDIKAAQTTTQFNVAPIIHGDSSGVIGNRSGNHQSDPGERERCN